MKCKTCGKGHKTEDHPKYSVKKKLTDKGFPVHAKGYKTAHEEADKAEKKKIDKTLEKHELAGKNTQAGKLKLNKKIPTALRREVAYHEEIESKRLRKK